MPSTSASTSCTTIPTASSASSHVPSTSAAQQQISPPKPTEDNANLFHSPDPSKSEIAALDSCIQEDKAYSDISSCCGSESGESSDSRSSSEGEDDGVDDDADDDDDDDAGDDDDIVYVGQYIDTTKIKQEESDWVSKNVFIIF